MAVLPGDTFANGCPFPLPVFLLMIGGGGWEVLPKFAPVGGLPATMLFACLLSETIGIFDDGATGGGG